ncbi:hypothetical protein QOT17_023961 [Balamuthia mandrillaris]
MVEEEGGIEVLGSPMLVDEDEATPLLATDSTTDLLLPINPSSDLGKQLIKTRRVEASVPSSMLNLTNSIVGVGILSIPYSYKLSGVFPGLFFTFFVWMASSYSFQVLGILSERTACFTYKGIALFTWGRFVALVGELAILLYTYLSLIARPMILSDYTVAILSNWVDKDSVLLKDWFIILIVTVVCLLPLASLPNIDALRFSSFFSLVCVIFSLGVVVLRFFQTFHWDAAELKKQFLHMEPFNWQLDMFMSFGLLIVSFTAHFNLPLIYGELKNRSTRKINTVIYSSSTLCLFLYTTMGLFGYMTFLNDTKDNILNNYGGGSHDVPVLIARIALCLAIIFSYPLTSFACRNAIMVIFFFESKFSWIRYFAVTILIVGSTSLLAFVLPNIRAIFGFSGAIFGVCFVFFLPGLFYLRLPDAEPTLAKPTKTINGSSEMLVEEAGYVALHRQANWKSLRRKIGAWFLMITGVVLGVMGTIGSIINLKDT